MSEYRPLTTDEVIALARQVSEAAGIAARRELIQRFYGPTAATVGIEAESEYNDEGGSYWSLQSLEVTDAQGMPLAPQPSAFTAEGLVEELRYDGRYWESYGGATAHGPADRQAFLDRVRAQIAIELTGLAAWRAAHPEDDWAEQEEFAHLLDAMETHVRHLWDSEGDDFFPNEPDAYDLLTPPRDLPTLYVRA